MSVYNLNKKTNDLDDKFRALEYAAPYLVEKLLKECIVETEQEADSLFMEVKKYMVMVQVEPEKMWQMYSLRVDEVWHQFVLYTRDYVEFCMNYFENYIHHAPSNSPEHNSPERKEDEHQDNNAESSIPTFDEFKLRYEELFGEPISELWLDNTSVGIDRRVVNYHKDSLKVCNGEQGMVELTLPEHGTVLMTVDSLARNALTFIAKTGAFYVRELPGTLTDEEKIGLVEILVESKVLRVAP